VALPWLLYVLCFFLLLILLVVFVKKLLRIAGGVAFGSTTPYSGLVWGSRLLAAIPLIPPVILAFALVAAETYNDQLVRRLAVVAVLMAFLGVAAALTSMVLLSSAGTRRKFTRPTLKNLILVNAVGLVSSVVVVKVFWHWVVQP
jgi:hypothetical protein